MKKKTWVLALSLFLAASSLHAFTVIQRQMSTDGNLEGSLIRASVRGKVLTFQVVIENSSARRVPYRFKFHDVYYTDTKEQKKYYLLKDIEGRVIAGPAHDWIGGGNFQMSIEPGKRIIFWCKGPAPPATTKTVDFYLPGFLPFEDIEITRHR